ncbi:MULTISPECIES: ABC-2 transporter permease [unclassified Staphylococcus]|uniref:phenol-soluble modulin export ABC transporter permease subunit PmtB n=1 Tax=unclassified Staphylococcus TaxID=91994 RepID=UPI0021CE24FE|nr:MULTISPECIES: ABC-2 transporter permease [unclassified Staphylococcus]UXR77790.1 ABC-2 transporter permease [Staphylococcus sp. IVB6227]UXR81949.1 ABC-2 transporter permease [Staphylococcus sp. IVB6214]
MLNLIKRNVYLHKNTLILYLILLLVYPIYQRYEPDYEMWFIPVMLIIFFICIADSAHAFRLQKRFGSDEAYLFQHSLPVSKKQLLNVHYITVMGLTILTVLLILLYDVNQFYIEVNQIKVSFIYGFIATNLLAFLISFPASGEQSRKQRPPMFIYMISILGFIPALIALSFVTIGFFAFDNPDYFSMDIGIYYVVFSILTAIFTYIFQMKRIHNT